VPVLAWSSTFAFILVVVIVELYVLVFLALMGSNSPRPHSYGADWLISLWTGGGQLPRGFPLEIMRLNVLLVVYIWLMSRTLDPIREWIHRLALIGSALALLAMQFLFARYYDLLR
jgi:hypothetical protein